MIETVHLEKVGELCDTSLAYFLAHCLGVGFVPHAHGIARDFVVMLTYVLPVYNSAIQSYPGE